MTPPKGATVAFIFARGGSKGVRGKNTRLLNGKPLIGYAIEQAAAARTIERIVVSTDSKDIASLARDFGAEVPFMRPPGLATDDAPEWLAWQHALDAVADVGLFVSVPATAPLRAPRDIDACVEMMRDSKFDIVLTVTPAARSPYFNMVSVGEDGLARLVMEPDAAVHRRQSAPQLFDIVTACYAACPDFIRRRAAIFEGRVGVVVVPAERAIDIDTELDFSIAEFLHKREHGNV